MSGHRLGSGRIICEIPCLGEFHKIIIALIIDIYISIHDTDCQKRKRRGRKISDEDLLYIPLAMEFRCVLHYIFTSYKHILSIQMTIILNSWGLVTSPPYSGCSEDCTVSCDTTVFADSTYSFFS